MAALKRDSRDLFGDRACMTLAVMRRAIPTSPISLCLLVCNSLFSVFLDTKEDFSIMEAENFSTGRENPSIALNKSIAEDRCLDMLKSKRFSIGGLGGFSDHFPTVSFHELGEEGIDKFDMIVSMVNSPKKGCNKKCRIGSIGFLSSSFFDEPGQTKLNRRCSISSVAALNRRGSMASVGTFASAGMESEEDGDDSVISEVGGNLERISVADLPSPTTSASQQSHFHSQPQPRPKPQLRLQTQALELNTLYRPMAQFAGQAPSILVTPTKISQVAEAFAAAMAQSHKSQQALHDWDKKMGLKRSHSKTMRLSMRSRKKLKGMLKKTT